MTYFKDDLIDSAINQQGVMAGLTLGTPIYVDSSDANNVYIGYCGVDKKLNKDEECLVVKITTVSNVSTKYFAYGAWADRATLQYK